MNITVLKDEKNEMELEIDSITLAELMRVYLNKDESVNLAAWKRQGFEKPVILKVKTTGKTVKKAVDDAISTIQKEINSLADDVKKAK